ncbi:MAG TPA: glycosyltransferase family 1 protein [Solirubrobacteraceae bacterium]|nr:glycosyltransferase family 1 protein [Solirubrobacteraceae bacterium]
MRIGLNLLYLVPGQVGGTEIYARHLVDALARLRPDDGFVAFAGVEAAPTLRFPPNVEVRRLPVKAANKPLRIAAELSLLPAAAARAKVDVLHSVGTTSPLVTPCPSVVTIHDLIYEHFPATFPAASRLGLKALVGPGARRATRVHAISEFTKRDVMERLRVPQDRIDVVLNGYGIAPATTVTSPAELRARLGLGDAHVVLCVSAALEHKNLRRLIEAMEGVDARLVVAGHAGRERLEGDGVVFTGWVDDADLEGLYRLATCAVYPSLFEGFGMPALEAMARGVPLACSNATSLPEVTRDAAELFDPRDVGAMREAIRRVLTRPPELVARGRERVKEFTWERCAEGVWEIYEKAARSPAST